MKVFIQKTISLFLSFLMPALLCAQSWPNGSFSPYSYPISSAVKLQNFDKFLESHSPAQWKQAIATLHADFEVDGTVDACNYNNVIANPYHMDQLDDQEAEKIVHYGHFIYAGGEKNSACAENLKNLIRNFLGSTYNENSPQFKRNGFLLMVAVAMSHNPYFSWDIEDMAFSQVEIAASHPVASDRSRWAAELLYLLAQDPVDLDISARSQVRHELFERRLERIIRKFNKLKDYRSDYYTPGVPCNDVLAISNQGSLISLFAQINNYLSMKNDDHLLKQMVSTGGFNFIGRGDRPAFSDKGETFYLHHVTPGTDGRGNVVDSHNGKAHVILHTLLLALFVSYNSRPSSAEASALMESFIASYLDTDKQGHFASYLYIPLQGMRIAKMLGDAYSLDGWEKEEAALQNKLYSILKDGYTGTVVCNYVQGTCEVVVEWLGVGKILGWIFRGGKAVTKAAANKIINVLPAKVLVHLGAAQVVTKYAFQWSKKNIAILMNRYGWKIVTAGGTAALLTGDERLRETVSY